MRLHAGMIALICLAASVADAQSSRRSDETALVPAWAPRALYVGTTWNTDTIGPALRLQWEVPILNQSGDALTLIGEAGGGQGLTFPKLSGYLGDQKMTSLYQYVVLAGVGVRSRRESPFVWGFHAALGPKFYGASFEAHPDENQVSIVVEGRGRAGWRFGRISAGIEAGYGSLADKPFRSAAAYYVSGFTAGLYVDLWQ